MMIPEREMVERALIELRSRGSVGISREEFPALFGNDRAGRMVMAHIRVAALAPVVVAKNGRGEVYRIAQSTAEYRRYRRAQIARIKSLVAAVQGLDRAWATHAKTTPFQLSLFDDGGDIDGQ